MYADEVSTNQLLGAYLNGDVTPEERAVVDKFLADDLSARQQLDELRKLTGFLKSGDRQVRAEAADQLRRAVMKLVRQDQIQAAMAAGMAGESSEQERALVQEHFAADPAARNDAQKLESFNTQMKQHGDRIASDAMSVKLRARLKEAAKPAVVISAAEMAGHQKPLLVQAPKRASLRIFVARETPWTNRLLVMSGLAAAVALLAGVEALRRNWSNDVPKVAVEDPKKKIKLVETKEGVRDSLPTHVNPPAPEVVKQDGVKPNLSPVQEVQNGVASPRENNQIQPAELPRVPRVVPEPVIVNQAPKVVPTAPQDTVKNVVAPENNSVVGNTPTVAPNNVAPAVPPSNSVANNSGNAINPAALINNVAAVSQSVPSVTKNPGTTGTGSGNTGTTATPTNTGTQNPGVASGNPGATPGTIQPTATTTAPTAGPASLVNKSGAGVAQVTIDGQITELKKGDSIPADALLETNENSHIAMSLSGGGRLYVNSNSKLVISYTTKGTTVKLSAGEIYFGNVGGGSMTVQAGNIKIENADEANVVIAGQLRAANIGGRLMKVTSTGMKKGSDNVASNVQASVSVDGSDVLKREAISAQTGYWRQDVLLDGDGIKAFQPGARVKR